MFELTYLQLLTLITIIWVIIRARIAFLNGGTSVKEELKMAMVYICIIVVVRIVYFPWHHVNGHIDTLKFDASKTIPPWVNLIPIVRLFDVYDGWQMNIIGNITMFIPVGIVWPICFKQLDTPGKAILAGAGIPLIIELTQLFFYERCSDVDDFLLNLTGFVIGALIYFGVRKIKSIHKSNT
ncbi:MAG: VanZ family protein [Lachnospiraceae bacterium]|nr:VanZ family protein [Lachnospiraceae bacterium]